MLVTQHDDAAFDRPDSTDSFYELSSALDNNDMFVVYNKKTEKKTTQGNHLVVSARILGSSSLTTE